MQRQAETHKLYAAILEQQKQQEAGNALMLTGISEPATIVSSPPQSPQQVRECPTYGSPKEFTD